ncbi:MAG: HEPN domain-containing protein, partial [Tepidiformaceae bacterium]
MPETRLAKAERSFHCADAILREGHLDLAAARAYYGSFYVAEALLDSLGLRFRGHGAVLSQ